MKSPVTLLDVATAANVSKSTVANVFSRPERVRPEVRDKVEAAARQLGFAGPDARGRLLSSGKAHAIGVVPSGEGIAWVFEDPYMRSFLGGVAAACQERNVAMQLIDGHGEAGGEAIRRAVVDGLILHTDDQVRALDPAFRRKMPVVVMDVSSDADISSVSIDDRGGAAMLARHLIGLGHRRFVVATYTRGYIAPVLHRQTGGPRQLVSAHRVDEERLAGVSAALAEAGLSINDMPLVEAWGSEEERRLFGSGADLILDNLDGATAVIALGGDIALSTLATARARGIDVPGALSIAGFDDPPEAAGAGLTAIAAPVAESARVAARLLFSDERRHVQLPVELVVRTSTAAPH
jgi:DNA-binding LacI/PurR family transcriptional regulator